MCRGSFLHFSQESQATNGLAAELPLPEGEGEAMPPKLEEEDADASCLFGHLPPPELRLG